MSARYNESIDMGGSYQIRKSDSSNEWIVIGFGEIKRFKSYKDAEQYVNMMEYYDEEY